jgi:hypothetical protein
MKLGLVGGILALLASLTTMTVAHASTTQAVYMTMFGWPDNSPPGPDIAYPGPAPRHAQAGGVGTYDDPVTFASSPKEFRVGSRVYVPWLKKYFVMEDSCASCVSDWRRSHRWHVDMWVGGEGGDVASVLACEDRLTANVTLVSNPARGLSVDSTPLFDSRTNTCYQPSGP